MEQAQSATATVTLRVAPIDDAPVATPQTVSVNEDTPKAVVLGGTDVDGDALTFALESRPTNGTLSGTLPNLTYTPNANWNGTDSFTFVAKSRDLTSAPATISLPVRAVNDAPVALPQTVSLDEDTPREIVLGASDVDGDSLTYQVNQALRGTLSGTAPNLVYTPNVNYNGTDSFSFRVFDGTVWSPLATVSLQIAPIGDAPITRNPTHEGREDVGWGFGLLVYASDPDGDVMQPSVTRAPAHGTVSLIPARDGIQASVSYRPNANWSGDDSFEIAVSDGTFSTPMTVTLRYAPVNDAPFIYGLSTFASEDGFVAIRPSTVIDVENDPTTQTVKSQPTNGTLTGELGAGTLVYRPNANWHGVDSFTIQANDGELDSNIATVTITVSPVNDAPVATGTELFVDEDGNAPITLAATDIEGDALTFTVSRAPQNGTLSGTLPNLTYTPRANFNGADSFAFTANDGRLTSSPATISIAVKPINDAPVAASQTVAAREDEPKAVVLAGSDIDGDTLSFSVVSEPSNGVLSGTAPNLTYTPRANWSGSDSFTFTVSDGTQTSAPATVTVNVASVDDAPVATPQSVSMNEDVSKIITSRGHLGGRRCAGRMERRHLAHQRRVDGNGRHSHLHRRRSLLWKRQFFVQGERCARLVERPGDGFDSRFGVNDAPTFNLSGNVSVRKNGNPETRVGFATAISPGAANEVDQSLTFIVTDSNASLWTSAPTIDASGTLRFAVARNRTGTATVSVRLKDNGGTENGGVDTSGVKTFLHHSEIKVSDAKSP
jgi:hypothetical protein